MTLSLRSQVPNFKFRESRVTRLFKVDSDKSKCDAERHGPVGRDTKIKSIFEVRFVFFLSLEVRNMLALLFVWCPEKLKISVHGKVQNRHSVSEI